MVATLSKHAQHGIIAREKKGSLCRLTDYATHPKPLHDVMALHPSFVLCVVQNKSTGEKPKVMSPAPWNQTDT